MSVTISAVRRMTERVRNFKSKTPWQTIGWPKIALIPVLLFTTESKEKVTYFWHYSFCAKTQADCVMTTIFWPMLCLEVRPAYLDTIIICQSCQSNCQTELNSIMLGKDSESDSYDIFGTDRILVLAKY